MRREIAYKVRINEILEGEYVVREGWDPNYIKTPSKNISRVNIIGTITEINTSSFTLDDGTASINLRSFDNTPFFASIGDVVLVIGRPREYQNERFIVPEIIKNLPDKEWIKVRSKQLKEKEEIIVETSENVYQKIIDVVSNMDKGEGVSREEILKELKIDDNEISRLLEEGELFEIRPGIIKLLS